jgi:RNA polymerase sigma factor (sigma-70 family)
LKHSKPKFYNSDMADLAHQLTLSPRRLRLAQIRGIEELLGLIDVQKAYPFEFVCFHITNYRKRGPTTGYSIPGKALIGDLAAMAELLSRRASIPLTDVDEPYHSHEQVAAELKVSTKTVRRWRDRGLMGIRVVSEDGVGRLVFLRRTVDRFKKRNKDLVARGASFTQLSGAERNRIVRRARELLAEQPMKLHAAAKVLSEETGRAVETVRYTLRRFDETHPKRALFADRTDGGFSERDLSIWRCHEAGDSNASIARAFTCSIDDVERVLRSVQLHKWSGLSWDHVHDELFDAPNADAIILDAPEPPPSDAPLPKPPKDVPSYLQSLYLTPLLTPEQERDLFRRYNYLKFKTAEALRKLDPDSASKAQYVRVADLMARVDATRQRITSANLRLVVSIAKKHVGWSHNFFEVVSDGNMSLMRAMEKFDCARGTKFSTYATWAIMKNYARSIPEQRYHYARYVTGQEEILSTEADRSTEPANESDREHVRNAIASGMSELDEREREIIASHFGLGRSGAPLTLEQLGKRFGVTKERVRQIEQRALARLREVLAPSLVDALTH